MSFPENILNRITRLFEDGSDDILIFILVFIFVFFSGQREDRTEDVAPKRDSGLPLIAIAVFLTLFLYLGYRRESGDSPDMEM